MMAMPYWQKPLTKTAAKLLIAFQIMEQKLTPRGLKPRLVSLDNEASQLLKNYSYTQYISFQVEPPYMHIWNAAELPIRSFKDRLISILCSTEKTLPMYLWDRLLPHAVITLHMLRTSRINPKISASTHIDGQYDYNRAQMAPPDTRDTSHETPNRRRTWTT
jgi:hypothetical protein